MMDAMLEALETELELMVRSRTVRHSTPRSPGGSSPSHLPAAQERAISVIWPASSSLPSFGSFIFNCQLLADSMAVLASLYSSTLFPPSTGAAMAVLNPSAGGAKPEAAPCAGAGPAPAA